MLRGALMIVRLTEEGAWKCAFRDFLREEWRTIGVSISNNLLSTQEQLRTRIDLRHGNDVDEVVTGEILVNNEGLPRVRSDFSEIALGRFRTIPLFGLLRAAINARTIHDARHRNSCPTHTSNLIHAQ